MVAGCSSPRIDAPSAESDPSAPEFVTPPDDPADDPQLAAVALPEDRAGTEASATIEATGAEFKRLELLTRALEAELRPDADVLLVELGAFTSVFVRVDGEVDQWQFGPGGALASTPLQGTATDRFTGEAFALADMTIAMPARVAVGLARRVPGASVRSIALSDAAGPPGLVWRFSLTRGGESVVVVATTDGAVLNVES